MIHIAIITEGGNIQAIVTNSDSVKITVIDNDEPNRERITERTPDSVLTAQGMKDFLIKEAEYTH